MSELTDLAVRVEAATGPDRELDIAILVAIDWREPGWEEGERTAKEMADRHGLAWLVQRSVEGYSSTWRHLPRLTASLDAAMMLVPEGCIWWMPFPNDARIGDSEGHILNPLPQRCATPALALTAACLRALSP